jgi:hypothetical protein
MKLNTRGNVTFLDQIRIAGDTVLLTTSGE